MAGLFAKGFDGYSTGSDISNDSIICSYPSSISISTSTRTTTGKCIGSSSSSPNVAITFNFLTAQDGNTLYQGFAFKTSATSLTILDVLNSTQTSQCSLYINALGKLELRRGSTILATSTTVINNSTWYYIELKSYVHPSSGAMELRINEAVECSFSGNTANAGSTSVSAVRFTFPALNTGLLDDWYCCNNTGSFNNTYQGDSVCEILLPTGDNAVQFTPSTGTNYSNVNKQLGSLNDSTYNSDAVSGHYDKFDLANLSVSPQAVSFVTVRARLSKSDTGAKQAKIGVSSGGIITEVIITPGTGFSNYEAVIDSANGSQWTEALINSALLTVGVA